MKRKYGGAEIGDRYLGCASIRIAAGHPYKCTKWLALKQTLPSDTMWV